MKTFQTGNTYSCKSICNQECVWRFQVTRRTAKSVWLKDEHGHIARFVIKVREGEEFVFPLGKYSMAPVLRGH